jgi:hypothetical protein
MELAVITLMLIGFLIETVLFELFSVAFGKVARA